jgi:hypothetical protein
MTGVRVDWSQTGIKKSKPRGGRLRLSKMLFLAASGPALSIVFVLRTLATLTHPSKRIGQLGFTFCNQSIRDIAIAVIEPTTLADRDGASVVLESNVRPNNADGKHVGCLLSHVRWAARTHG